MSTNALQPVGDGSTLNYCNTGTLTLGTLTAGTLTGQFKGSVVAVGVMTPLTTLIDLTPNSIDVKEVDITDLASAADETQPGTPSHGEVAAMIAYNAANTTLINGFVSNKTVQFYSFTNDDATTDSSNAFLGWIKKWTPMGKGSKKDERLQAELTIKITGKPLFTAGS